MLGIVRCAPPGPVVIVGTDVPGIRRRDIDTALRLLRTSDVVLGPAGDGGYWLIAVAHRRRRAVRFTAVRWSSAHALEDTERSLAGLSIRYAACIRDVDHADDLEHVRAWAGRRVLPAAIG